MNNSIRVCLYQDTSRIAKKIVARRYFKVCAEKCALTGPWRVLSTVEMKQKFIGFPVTTS